jgi:hypothetical protein
MRKLRVALIIIFLFKIVSVSYGWGKVGHNIIAEIAKTYVTASIQDSVSKYLGTMSWESASTWMDEIKSDSQYDYMRIWHYVNIEKGMQYDSSNAGGNNVVNHLQIAIKNLMNKSKLTKEEIIYNLKILFHLMGDLHQPLHVGYKSDKGGNDIKVTFKGKTENLHHIWDSGIIEYKNITFKDVQHLYSALSKQRIKKISGGDVMSWLKQTRKFLPAVYRYSNTISDNYINKSCSITEKQLLYAGIRLGKILDNVFKK